MYIIQNLHEYYTNIICILNVYYMYILCITFPLLQEESVTDSKAVTERAASPPQVTDSNWHL